MSEVKETGWFRGAGGAVWEMDLPLGENYLYQVGKGELTRVNEDGTPYTQAPAKAEPAAKTK